MIADIERTHLRTSRFLYAHLRYYVREMRIVAYAQLLESYRSLTIASMAQAFGVTEDYIDRYVIFLEVMTLFVVAYIKRKTRILSKRNLLMII